MRRHALTLSVRMKDYRYWIVQLSLLICATTAAAQTDAQLNHYFMAMGAYNPASVGMKSEIGLTALYRLQWLGLDEGAPRSIFVATDMPFRFRKTENGVGVMVFNDDKSTLYKDMFAAVQVAHKRKVGKGVLSIGLQAGMINSTFQGSKARPVPEGTEGSTDHSQDDDAIPKEDLTAKGLDVAVGLMYSTDRYYVGLASTHLTSPTLDLSDNFGRKVYRGYNLIAGYNIPLRNPLVELRPSLLVQSDLQMSVGDVTLRAVYKKMFNGGLGLRISDSGTTNGILYLGADIAGFRVSYAYEYPFSALSRTTFGSHEAVVTYRVQLTKPKEGRNRHKSIRIL